MTTKKTAKKALKAVAKRKPAKRMKAATTELVGTPSDALSVREEMFVDNILDGLNATESYHKTDQSLSRETAAVGGNKWLRKDKIKDAIKFKREILQTGNTLTRQRKRELLFKIAESGDEDVKTSDKTTAIKIDNQMTGDEAPIKHVGEITIGHVVKNLDDTTGIQR